MMSTDSLPSRRGHRPSALNVSFSTDLDDSATASDASSRKRDRSDAGNADLRGVKRRNLDSVARPVRKYERRPYEVNETNDLLLIGEDEDPPDDGRKRARRLTRFTFFDDRHDNAMVSLDVLTDGVHNAAHHVLGAGFVVPIYDIDEDQGQEDDLYEYGEEQYIRTSQIKRYYTRYCEANSPFFVETDHAIYELDGESVSKRFRKEFRSFWKTQTILKFVISSAVDDPEQEYSAFIRKYSGIKVFGESLEERELWDAVPKLRETLETVSHGDDLRASRVIHYLLHRLVPVVFKPIGRKRLAENLSPKAPLYVEYKGNLDLAVLRMSTRIRATPLIAQMADRFYKDLYIIGRKPPPEPAVPKDDLAKRLQGFLERTQTRRRVQFRPEQRIGRTEYLRYTLIDGVKYEIGDTVLFYSGNDIPRNIDNLPPSAILADYFWFARILHINDKTEMVHVQWFEHSSKTLLQQLGRPQELFLINQCDTLYLKHIIGNVKTHYIESDQTLADVGPYDFFYRYLWDDYNGTFTNVDVGALAAAAEKRPPDNCPVCYIAEEFEKGTEATRIHLGIQWHGIEYHLDDCVRIKEDMGTCLIGQIIRFDIQKKEFVVRAFGRTDRIGCRPDTMLKDERHLFYTDYEREYSFHNLIGVCYVVVKDYMPDLDTWLAMSPYHFYVKYHFPSINVVSWADRRRMRWDGLAVCRVCVKGNLKKFKGMKTFLERQAPLRTFDPFAGTGSFALAMEEVGCFKLTHAAEISPSAAETLRKNASPDVKVYNQCGNVVLHHAILAHENKHTESLKSVEGRALPPFPQPGDIDCIVTGFPCQPHSTLNMFQKANDNKSGLIVTVLSFVDFLKPQYCLFENVRGFLQYSLLARQKNEYSVKGGVPVGGLKFVVASLLDMGYQVRFALLQAGHYGTPQTRVRFFLIAAKRGLELPAFPQPTHDSPEDAKESLAIKFPEELTLRPITTVDGFAPHRHVSVHDAISDLPKFEWKHPKKELTRRQMEERSIKECRADRPWCGLHGPDVPYEHEPRTTYQKKCRSQPTRDIQQYTRTYQTKKVERIVDIPVEEGADYRNLLPHQREWQLANPASSVARAGYRPGYYGRVNGNKWFQTTVTHVDPTGKQCRVIHPTSRRIVTVRELARSQGFPDHFVFYAKENRVMTMHRQIGNAVPWLVSTAIAREFRESLYKAWAERNPPGEPVEEEFSDNEATSRVGIGMDVD